MTSDANASAINAKPKLGRMDPYLFGVTLCLIAFGIVSVFDASYAAADQAGLSPFKYVKLQAGWAVCGLGVMFWLRRVSYLRFQPFANTGILITYALLVAVFIPHIGIHAKGAHRWIGYGGMRVQPSEIAKITVMLYLANYAAARPNRIKNFKNGLLRPLLMMGGIVMLVAAEPDLGTAMVIAAASMVVLFLSGVRWQHMLAVIVGACLVVTLLSFHGNYRRERLLGYLHPRAHRMGSTYQVWHSMVAIGTGGISGKGLGEGIEKMYIPEPRTDFIFAVIAEEWGLIGTLGLLVAFSVITVRGYHIAYKATDPFAGLLAAGITSVIAVQTGINIAVATGTIPNTGVPLPFVSYGGSSLVFMLVGVSILLNISRHQETVTLPLVDSQYADPQSNSRHQSHWDRRTKLTERDFLRTYNVAVAKGNIDFTGLPRRLDQLTRTAASKRNTEEQPNTFARDWTNHE